jgi:hypothetical protein
MHQLRPTAVQGAGGCSCAGRRRAPATMRPTITPSTTPHTTPTPLQHWLQRMQGTQHLLAASCCCQLGAASPPLPGSSCAVPATTHPSLQHQGPLCAT